MSGGHRGESPQSVPGFLLSGLGDWYLLKPHLQDSTSWIILELTFVLGLESFKILLQTSVSATRCGLCWNYLIAGFTVCPRVYRCLQLSSNIPFEVCMLIRCDVWNFLYNFCFEIVSYFLSTQEAIEGLILATKLCLIILMCSGKYWNGFDMINIYFLLLHQKKKIYSIHLKQE